MNMTFNQFTAYDEERLNKYASLRPIYISERQFINQFIWENYYNTTYYCNNKYLIYVSNRDGNMIPMMPFCKLEDIPDVFTEIKDYWNNDLNLPLNMYFLDKPFIESLKANPSFEEEFEIIDDRDSYDYIYDAEQLKALRGKKFHKKRNHLNRFLRTYKGRYEYKTINCNNIEEVDAFFQIWLNNRGYEDIQDTIQSEDIGVREVFQNCNELDCKLGSVYVDDVLQAFTIGTYDPSIECAFIHTEKANTQITGLYNFINQQFLINAFPDAKLVNREDDLGQPGLRKSKLSYRPIRLEEKYFIKQKTSKKF